MKAQATLDDKTMRDLEDKWMKEGKSPSVPLGIAGAASELHGGFKGLLAPIGNASVAAMDPDYGRYLAAQRSYGRVMGNLQSKRYSDTQAEIERSISGMAANDLANTIKYKQALRAASLNDPSIETAPAPMNVNGIMGGKSVSTTAAPSAPSNPYLSAGKRP